MTYINKNVPEFNKELDELRGQMEVLKDELEKAKKHLSIEINLRKQVEEELELSKNMFTKVFNLSPVLMCITSVSDGRFIDVNEIFLQYTGFKLEEVVGRTALELNLYVNPNDVIKIREWCRNQETIRNMEVKYHTKSGEIMVGLLSTEIVNIAGQKCVLSLIKDVTEKRKMVEELEKSNHQINNILDSITDAFFALDNQWRFTYVNKKVEQLWGIKREALIGKVIWDEFPETVGTPFYNEYDKAILQQKAVCFEALSPIINRWVEVHVYPSKEGLSVYFHDITERKKTEEKLRLSEERFFKAFNFSPNPMCIKTLSDFKYIGVNDSWLQCIGYSREEVIGRTATELGLPAFLKDGTNIAKMIREQKSVHNLELDFSTNLGNNRTGLLSTEIIDIEGEKCVLSVFQDITERKLAEKALETERERLYFLLDGLPGYVSIVAPDYTVRFANRNYREAFGKLENRYCYEIRQGRQEPCKVCYARKVFETQKPCYWECILPNGKVQGIYDFPFSDIDGSSLVIVINFDITEKKRIEQELSRLSRLNLIGEMAAGIAHEIRNPLTTVRGFLQMLGGKSDYAKYKDYHNLMITELDRANLIITEFLSLAKSKTDNLKMQNLNLIVQAILPLINADAMNSDKYIEVELEDIPDLLLNNKEIRQLLLNLVRNGLDSMTPGKYLRIKTFVDGEQVVLAVQDQGKGIEPKTLEKLGTPFFTTKDDGTGLGLAICYSIAARHNATIDIETDSNGTTFYVRFRSLY